MNQSLPINDIFTRKDARKIDEATVGRLMESIREIGLINPIRVRETSRPDHPQAWEVIAGGHRLRAMRKLGFESISAVIVNDDDLHAELAMIDENLMRAELSAADRAHQTARRKAVYLELHPETAHGANQHTRGVDKLSTPTERFTAATAEAIGKDERTVRRDAERGEKITDDALELIRGTHLDKGSELDKLKKVALEKQVSWVKDRLATPVAAKASRKKEDGVEQQLGRLKRAWQNASDEARAIFMSWAAT